jgi:SAM-dependent methyltransferase
MSRPPSAPAALRNREPILEVLRTVLPERGLVLELASGTGQHAVHCAAALPKLTWQPSDRDPDALAIIRSWIAEARLPNVREPIAIDAASDDWGIAAADAIVCVNMIHISPWSACEGLFRGAARLLPPGAPLFLYGPFRFHGSYTAPSNDEFDASLRARDPSWGVRDVADLTRLGEERGLARHAIVEMPANNHSIVFRRVAP